MYFPGAEKMGFPVISEMLLLSIFSFQFPASTSIFYESGCRLSITWLFTLQRYGGSVRYQTPGDALFG